MRAVAKQSRFLGSPHQGGYARPVGDFSLTALNSAAKGDYTGAEDVKKSLHVDVRAALGRQWELW